MSALFSTNARGAIIGLVIRSVLGYWCKQPDLNDKADNYLSYIIMWSTIHHPRQSQLGCYIPSPTKAFSMTKWPGVVFDPSTKFKPSSKAFTSMLNA